MRPARGLLLVAAAAALASSGATAAGFDDLDDLVFVANRTSPEIAVVDSASDEVVGHVTTAGIPQQFVLAAATAKLIASHRASDLLSIVDLRSGELQRLDPGIRPEQLQTSPDGGEVAIASSADDAVVLLSLAGDHAIRRIDGLAQPGDLVFDRDGRSLFVASRARAEVAVVDVGAARVASWIALESEPGGSRALVRTPGGELGFALHGDNGLVSVIDLRARRWLATTALPGPALRGYPTADSQHVLVPNGRDGTVSLISTWSFAESARLPGAAAVSGVNTGMFDALAVVLSRADDRALLLDLFERRRSARSLCPRSPRPASARPPAPSSTSRSPAATGSR